MNSRFYDAPLLGLGHETLALTIQNDSIHPTYWPCSSDHDMYAYIGEKSRIFYNLCLFLICTNHVAAMNFKLSACPWVSDLEDQLNAFPRHVLVPILTASPTRRRCGIAQSNFRWPFCHQGILCGFSHRYALLWKKDGILRYGRAEEIMLISTRILPSYCPRSASIFIHLWLSDLAYVS